jgi:hypothetical protein
VKFNTRHKKVNLIGLIVIGVAMAIGGVDSLAADSLPTTDIQRAARGWWFYDSIPKNNINSTMMTAIEKNCTSSKEWSIECGFIKPTTYDFEQIEYKRLLQNYSMHPDDLNAVYQYQRFNYWAVNQAMLASYSWEFNLAQYPNLDSTITNPISQFGNLLVLNANKKAKSDFFKLLSGSGILVYFSRSDCSFCLSEADVVMTFSKFSGLPVWNASLDKKLLPGFTKGLTVPSTRMPAMLLNVDIVPTLFLYLTPSNGNKGGQWIRIATGITSQEMIEDRIINFVEAYYHALITGVSDSNSKFDFTDIENNQLIKVDFLRPDIHSNTNRKII